jgi:hypothetical protein
MTSLQPACVPCQWFARLAAALDKRSAPRLALLFLGAVLARGRRTVTTRSCPEPALGRRRIALGIPGRIC